MKFCLTKRLVHDMTNLEKPEFLVAVVAAVIRLVVPAVSAASSTHFSAVIRRLVEAGDNNLDHNAAPI